MESADGEVVGRIYEPAGSRLDHRAGAAMVLVDHRYRADGAQSDQWTRRVARRGDGQVPGGMGEGESRFLMTHNIYGPWWAWAALAIAGRDADGHRRGPIGALVRFAGRIQNNSGPPQGPESGFRGGLRLR